MQRQDIETKIPEFKWDNTTIKFDVPEFTMQRQRIVLGLPQFTVTEIHLNEHKIEQQSEALKDKAGALQKSEGLDLVDAMHAVFSCHRSELVAEQASALHQFDDGINNLTQSINDVSAKGVDVTKVTDGNGNVTNLRTVLADLIQKRADADGTFKDALDKLDASEKDAVKAATTTTA